MSTFKERLNDFDMNNLHFASDDAKLLGGALALFGLLVISKVLRKKVKK